MFLTYFFYVKSLSFFSVVPSRSILYIYSYVYIYIFAIASKKVLMYIIKNLF